MSTKVGIFQEKEQLESYLATKGIDPQPMTVVGPFPNRLKATEWMDFIEKKQGEMERHAVGYMNGQPWYGMTFK